MPTMTLTLTAPSIEEDVTSMPAADAWANLLANLTRARESAAAVLELPKTASDIDRQSWRRLRRDSRTLLDLLSLYSSLLSADAPPDVVAVAEDIVRFGLVS